MSRKGYTKLVDAPSYENYSASAADESRSRDNGNRSNGRGMQESSRLVAEPQNVKSKNVYVFGDGTIADTEDETLELTQMSRRSNQNSGAGSYKSTASSSQYDDIVTKEIPLQKTDTLQSLSIKFRCPVSNRTMSPTEHRRPRT